MNTETELQKIIRTIELLSELIAEQSLNAEKYPEKTERTINVLSELIAEKNRKKIELKITGTVLELVTKFNSDNDSKEDASRFPVTWSQYPGNLPANTRGIFFLCDLYHGEVIYVGESRDPARYLQHNEERRRHDYDSVAVLELPIDYYHGTPKVYAIRKGTFHQLFAPKDNKRYSW